MLFTILFFVFKKKKNTLCFHVCTTYNISPCVIFKHTEYIDEKLHLHEHQKVHLRCEVHILLHYILSIKKKCFYLLLFFFNTRQSLRQNFFLFIFIFILTLIRPLCHLKFSNFFVLVIIFLCSFTFYTKN